MVLRKGAIFSLQNMVIALVICGIVVYIFLTYGSAHAESVFRIVKIDQCAKTSCLDCSFFIKEHCPDQLDLYSRKAAGDSKLETGKLTLIFNRELGDGEPVAGFVQCSGSAPVDAWPKQDLDYSVRGARLTISNLKAGCQYAVEVIAKSKEGEEVDEKHRWIAFRR
jgi:hypothetical protein